MTCLALFLESRLNFTEGAVRAGLSTARFRSRVFEDIALLSRLFDVSFYPLRLPHLRYQTPSLLELLNLYHYSDIVP